MPLPGGMEGLQGGQERPTRGTGITSRIANAKKPKVRPARGLRDTVLFPVRSLPTYTGPYHVGTMEIEVPVREPKTFSNITRHGRHILGLETVLMTIYYPASPPSKEQGTSRELWLGRPRMSVARGYGKFSGLGNFVLPIFLPTVFTKLPAWRNAPLSKQAPVPEEKDGPKQRKKSKRDRLQDISLPPKFPLIMFSHGLGGTRTMYSSMCGEFASYGFVVCAVEHRDGSGPRTFINHPPDQRPHEKDAREATAKDRKGPVERGDDYDTVDYVFPKGNEWDTSPANEKGVDHELRDAQIDLRMAEIEEAFEVLKLIGTGLGSQVASKNLRRKGFKGGSSGALEGIDWEAWKDRFYLNDATALGHSFGGATTVEMLRHLDRFNWISQGVILDIWSAGTRTPIDDAHKVHSPILAINSEAFTYWPQNYEFVENLTSESNPSPTWLMTIRGTVHISPSDFAILYPRLCSILLKTQANPRRALDLHVNAALEFLRIISPKKTSAISIAFPNEGLLMEDVNLLDQIPTIQQHRPAEKWTAARLRIEHEWVWRMAPGVSRKIAKKEIVRQGGRPGEEVWLHTKPLEEDIEKYFVERPDMERLRNRQQTKEVRSSHEPSNSDVAPADNATESKSDQ